jgi:predicted nuclease of predicted toxin-antitoxin system
MSSPAKRSPLAEPGGRRPVPPKLLADECCDGDLVLLLRQAGYDLRYVAEGDAGRSDEEVLRLAVEEGRVLLTEDTDFGELVVRLGKPAVGVVLLRLAGEPPAVKAARVQMLLGAPGGRRVEGHHVVVGRDRLRFRALGGSRT